MTPKIKVLGPLLAALAMSALTASAAQANPADFAASSYPAHLVGKGIGTEVFMLGSLKITCSESEGVSPLELTAVAEEQSGSLNFGTPEGKTGTEVWANCHASILKIPLIMHQNGCEYEFTAGSLVSDTEGTTAETGATATGSISIVNCDDSTKGITIAIGSEGSICHVDIPEQQPTSGSVHYHNEVTEDGSTDVLATSANIQFTAHTTGGSQCSGNTEEPVSVSTTYNGDVRFTATEEKDVTVVGT